jgi:ribonuclease BN (tRNA processing enzyme)
VCLFVCLFVCFPHSHAQSGNAKQRIKSNIGHLSNKQAMEILNEISAENIFISHISEQNNSYDKIKSDILKHLSCKLKNKNFYFTFQNKASNIISTVKK